MDDQKEFHPPRRSSNLSDTDLQRLRDILLEHPCKFSVSHEEMDNIKRMSQFFQKVEDKVISGLTWVFIAIIGGMFWMLYNHGYFFKDK